MKFLMLIIITVIMLISACEEFEVLPVTPEDEIERYLSDSYIGESLFKQSVFLTSREYTFTGNDTVYTETVDSIVRSLDISIPVDSLIDLQFGSYHYAEITAQDKLYVSINKMINNQSNNSSFTRLFVRNGLLVKIGDDNQKYSGWVLYGFQANNHDLTFHLTKSIILKKTNEITFTPNVGTISYFPIDSLTEVPGNATIIGSYNINSVSAHVFSTYEKSTGFSTDTFKVSTIDNSLLIDSLSISAANNRFGNVIFIESVTQINDSTFNYNYSCQPFKYSN